MKVKFMYNGIKVDGKLYAGSWSRGGYIRGNDVCFETVTFYRRGCGTLPLGIFAVENDSDITIDYIDGDRVHFIPEHSNHAEAVQAWKTQEIKRAKREIIWWEKRIASGKVTRYTETYLAEAKEKLAKLAA